MDADTVMDLFFYEQFVSDYEAAYFELNKENR